MATATLTAVPIGRDADDRAQGLATRTSSLFEGLRRWQPMCNAVLDGAWPGNLWADSAEDPRAAILITFLGGGGAAWCFLAGDATLPRFNEAVHRALFEDRLAGEAVDAFLLTCDPNDWGGRLGEIGRPREPALQPRRHYTCRSLASDWRERVPEGYGIEPLRTDMLSDRSLHLPSTLRATLGAWRSARLEGCVDFGFAARREDELVAWATVDFVAGGMGDLGFETLPKHRRRGLGTAVAGAALDRACGLGLTTHWTCAEDNTPSHRAAERLGLARGDDYEICFYQRDESAHAAQAAYTRLRGGDASGALARFEALFARQADVPVWAYHDAAEAAAATGDASRALTYLRIAAKHGWSSTDTTESTPAFAALRDLPEWASVLDRMRHNASG